MFWQIDGLRFSQFIIHRENNDNAGNIISRSEPVR